MVRVNEGLPVHQLPMIVPEPRQPPQPEFFEQPLPEAMQAPLPENTAREDPVEALLREILGRN